MDTTEAALRVNMGKGFSIGTPDAPQHLQMQTAGFGGTLPRSAAYNGMSANDYLEMAKHCRRAKEATRDSFTRRYLEDMERSYRVLAASEAALEAYKKAQAVLDESKP
ncbi:hypothetical protein AB7M49_003725 [Bradyrhizobium elkanii]|uniref:hypothetical protein n=1 Tax=Bradyrhizobium brasilense TaxID=1419277 RepID=UPI0014564EC2|nr:hypothetical protein [Bradyrhizobium brasilense]NLS67768.1 hypothetical protein [Bradyrhizobium brasilense]